MIQGKRPTEAASWQKEEISRAYLHAMAARAGCTIGSWSQDKDGVDATVRRLGRMFDVQLKCTQEPRKLSEAYSYDLDVETYDKLRDPDRSAPGYLFVMIVPKDISEWIHLHPEDYMLLRCTAYYARIQNRPAVDTKATTAIHLPFTNRVTGEAIDHIFEHAKMHALGHREGLAA